MQLWAPDVKDQLQERNPVSSLVVYHSLVGNNGQFGHCVTTRQNSTDAERALQQTQVPTFVMVMTKKPECVCFQMQMI